MINRPMIEAYYRRCDNIKNWNNVIRCAETIEIQNQFIKELLIDLLKVKEDVCVNDIMTFREYILRYLEGSEQEEYEMN